LDGIPVEQQESFMLTGKRFKLSSPTVAIDVVAGKDTAVIIPAEAIINVLADPTNGDQMLDIGLQGGPAPVDGRFGTK
jgi:hypothetical protein